MLCESAMRPEVDRRMNARATVVVMVGALVATAAAAASCGEPFTLSSSSGTGGKGGAGGANATASATSSTTTTATATASSSSSSEATASTGTGSSMDAGGCSYLSPDCGTKAFCVVDSCDKAGTGTCKPLALLDKDALKPLCGCDGFTYWSGVEVIAANQPVGAMGECTDM